MSISGISDAVPAGYRGLITLLFTDIVDSTATKQRLGEQGAAALFRRHHELLRQVLAESSGGEEIETAGDSFFLTFKAPSDAVRFATQLQIALKELSAKGGILIQDRIGIHLGEALMDSQTGTNRAGLFGLSVDHCARVMSVSYTHLTLPTTERV